MVPEQVNDGAILASAARFRGGQTTTGLARSGADRD
jgi:hypothetical protein